MQRALPHASHARLTRAAGFCLEVVGIRPVHSSDLGSQVRVSIGCRVINWGFLKGVLDGIWSISLGSLGVLALEPDSKESSPDALGT